VGVLVYRQALNPHPVGAAHAYWQRLARVEVGVMMEVGVVEAVGAVPRVDDPTEGEAEEEDDTPNPHPPCLGHAPIPPNYLPLEVPGARAEPLEPWVKRIYNDVYI